ncbi:PepSY-associated TM helix domain-containing protein [Marinimicrobium sp. ARAG 43.8]|uniref:PepSY-associated TM helix domain-containing protein n=1 Tax=Marinimicrobium sp. ARAG 43.8 TaxID=3418719 RepID=UPI003CE71F61
MGKLQRKIWNARNWHWVSSAICLAGILLFAITGITLNHAAQIGGEPDVQTQTEQVPDTVLPALMSGQPLPSAFTRWYNDNTSYHLHPETPVTWSPYELYASFPRAGGDRWFTVDLETGEFYQEVTNNGWLAYLNDLHKGRNTGWVWRLFIDVFSVACIVFSITGLMLLWKASKKRKSTWPLIIAGIVIPILLLMIPVHASANDQLTVEIPRLSVAEYHEPYVAIWLADERGQRVMDLAVWYDVKLANREGEKWLKDMRLWWRRSGRFAEMPIDGVTGATRRPGRTTVDLSSFRNAMNELPAGQYSIFVEAARELGGRETVEVPLTLPVTDPLTLTHSGEHELGAVTLTLEPQ